MYKQTLEILPLAILLTVIMTFGAKSANYGNKDLHDRGQFYSRRDFSNEKVKEFSDYLAGNSDLMARGLTLESIAVDTVVGESRTGRDGSDVSDNNPSPSLFLEKSPSNSAIPFFTSHDIARSVPKSNRSVRLAGSTGVTGRVPGASSSSAATADDRLDVNAADEAMLQRIPGIGPSKANLIVSQRPSSGFSRWEDLLEVPGIGKSTLATIQLHAVLGRG